MALVQVTPPASEPLTLDEVKQHLRIDGTTDNQMLELLISSARAAAETVTRRALVTQTWDLVLDRFPPWEMFIPKPCLRSVTSIAYVDSNGAAQTLDTANYLVDAKSEPGRIAPAFGQIWPITRWQMNAVTVRFVCGYGGAPAVPQGIKSWMLMRIATLWENRSAVEIEIYIKSTELPPAFVDGLLDPFAVPNFGWAA